MTLENTSHYRRQFTGRVTGGNNRLFNFDAGPRATAATVADSSLPDAKGFACIRVRCYDQVLLGLNDTGGLPIIGNANTGIADQNSVPAGSSVQATMLTNFVFSPSTVSCVVSNQSVPQVVGRVSVYRTKNAFNGLYSARGAGTSDADPVTVAGELLSQVVPSTIAPVQPFASNIPSVFEPYTKLSDVPFFHRFFERCSTRTFKLDHGESRALKLYIPGSTYCIALDANQTATGTIGGVAVRVLPNRDFWIVVETVPLTIGLTTSTASQVNFVSAAVASALHYELRFTEHVRTVARNNSWTLSNWSALPSGYNDALNTVAVGTNVMNQWGNANPNTQNPL